MWDVCTHGKNLLQEEDSSGQRSRAEVAEGAGLHLQRTDFIFPEAGGRLVGPVEEMGL